MLAVDGREAETWAAWVNANVIAAVEVRVGAVSTGAGQTRVAVAFFSEAHNAIMPGIP